MAEAGDSTNTVDGAEDVEVPAHVEGLLSDLDDLAGSVESSEALEEIDETRQLLVEAHEHGLIESEVRTLDHRDAAEALVGSIVFASPLLVEDGVFDIANYLFGFTVWGIPIFLLANTAFVIFMTYALLEWTGRDKKEARSVFGLVPTRVVMTLVISFVVSAILMTVWGRVGDWQPPVEALARVNVLWTVGSLGAALGDILSGENAPETVEA